MDVSSRQSVRELVETATAVGAITGVIHAAGVSPTQASPATILRVDLYGTAGGVTASYWFGELLLSRPRPNLDFRPWEGPNPSHAPGPLAGGGAGAAARASAPEGHSVRPGRRGHTVLRCGFPASDAGTTASDAGNPFADGGSCARLRPRVSLPPGRLHRRCAPAVQPGTGDREEAGAATPRGTWARGTRR